MSIRCITFDLDDTLWECMPVIQRAERLFYAWLQQHCIQLCRVYSIEALQQHRTDFKAQHPEWDHDLTTLRKNWLAYLFQKHHCDLNLLESAFQVYWQARNAVDFFDNAPTKLAALSKYYRLGVITNGNADVHFIGIGHLFDFTVHAAEVGCAKPNPYIFEVALKRAGVERHEMVHVGDHPEADILAASRLGIRTVWMNRDYTPWPGGQTPDAVIRRLDELEAVLTVFNQSRKIKYIY